MPCRSLPLCYLVLPGKLPRLARQEQSLILGGRGPAHQHEGGNPEEAGEVAHRDRCLSLVAEAAR